MPGSQGSRRQGNTAASGVDGRPTGHPQPKSCAIARGTSRFSRAEGAALATDNHTGSSSLIFPGELTDSKDGARVTSGCSSSKG